MNRRRNRREHSGGLLGGLFFRRQRSRTLDRRHRHRHSGRRGRVVSVLVEPMFIFAPCADAVPSASTPATPKTNNAAPPALAASNFSLFVPMTVPPLIEPR